MPPAVVDDVKQHVGGIAAVPEISEIESLPVSNPSPLNDENSRAKIQNVRGDSSADCQFQRGPLAPDGFHDSDAMSTLRDMRELFASIEAPGAFATRRTTSADELHLEVK
jgi:hypothetical protein